jgi:hypothetical protein
MPRQLLDMTVDVAAFYRPFITNKNNWQAAACQGGEKCANVLP